jgi:hypothetical protein
MPVNDPYAAWRDPQGGLNPTIGAFGPTDPNYQDPRFPNGNSAAWTAWASASNPNNQTPGAPNNGGFSKASTNFQTTSDGGGNSLGQALSGLTQQVDGFNSGAPQVGSGGFGRTFGTATPMGSGAPGGAPKSFTPGQPTTPAGTTPTGAGGGGFTRNPDGSVTINLGQGNGDNPLGRGGTGNGGTGDPNNPALPFNFNNNGFGSWGQFLLDPQLQGGFSDALKAAISRFSDPNGQTYYSGQTVAGLTPDELQAANLVRTSAATGAGGVIPAAGQTFQNLTGLANGGTDPALEQAISAMKTNAYQDFNGPDGPMATIRSSAMGDGAYGGSRQAIAEGVAGGRLGAALANTEGQMRLQDQTQNRDRAAAVLGQTGNLVNSSMAPATMLSAAGSQARGVDQANLDSNLQAWQYNTTQPDVRLQNLFGALGASLPLGGVKVNQQVMPDWMMQALQNNNNGQGGNNLASILALLGGVGGMYSAFTK